jgi:hypothetical protein
MNPATASQCLSTQKFSSRIEPRGSVDAEVGATGDVATAAPTGSGRSEEDGLDGLRSLGRPSPRRVPAAVWLDQCTSAGRIFARTRGR